MSDIVSALKDAPLSTIFVLAGLLFIFVAIGGRFGTHVTADRIQPLYASLVGIALLLSGILIYVLSMTGRGKLDSDFRTLVSGTQCDIKLFQNVPYEIWHKGPEVKASDQSGQLVIKNVSECAEGKCFKGEVTFSGFNTEPDTVIGNWRESKIVFVRIVKQLHRGESWEGACLPSSIVGLWRFKDNQDDYGPFIINY